MTDQKALIERLCALHQKFARSRFDPKRAPHFIEVSPNDAGTLIDAMLHIETIQPNLDALRAELAETKAKLATAREALDEICNLSGEINPSNYDHDDACELNRQFCYAISIASTALDAIKEKNGEHNRVE